MIYLEEEKTYVDPTKVVVKQIPRELTDEAVCERYKPLGGL